jgi:transcriptional regulator with XRE-family HTH domain
MARAALDWGIRELAEKSKVSRTTIVRFERGHVMPIPATLKVLRQTLEEAGVEFTNGDQPGVRLKQKDKD